MWQPVRKGDPVTARRDAKARVGRMVDACREWNEQASALIGREIERRRRTSQSNAIVVKALIGFSVLPNPGAPRRVVIFEGLRNKVMFSLFPPGEVYILGSHEERDYAARNGHGFLWQYPIQSAMILAVYRGWSGLARIQVRRWRRWIARRDVTVFLYEDTQGVGAFFALLRDPDDPSCRVACIQHGHYTPRTVPCRPEGGLTEYNLVWDVQQGEWISDRPEKTRVVGLPYEAMATPCEGALPVVLVGLGATAISTHDESIRLYTRVCEALKRNFEVDIAYRPHPNEFLKPEKIAQCEALFGRVDRTPKIDLLNGPRALFVGEVSSLLFEANQTGHLTAYIEVDRKFIPSGYHDLDIDPDALDGFVRDLRAALAEPLSDDPGRAARGDPLVRFAAALSSLGMLPDRSGDAS